MTRTLDFRYVIVRNGADFGELHPLSAPTIRCDDEAEIKTSLSGTFLNSEIIDWLSDAIRVEMIVDGVTYSLGVFLPATVVHSFDGITEQVDIEAYDRCWIVKDNCSESIEYFASGTLYLNAISQLLTSCGISIVSKVDNSAAMTEAREDWNVGTSYLEIVNQLLSEINYKPLWFDSQGTAILEPVKEPSADNIQYTFDSNNVKSLMLPTITREMDIYQAPNVFVVVCSNADKSSGMIAKSENNNPQSPLSIARRGRRIVSVIQVDNIASQSDLQKYADTLRNQSMLTGETIEITTALLPNFGVDDVVALIYDDISTICVERAWEMRLEVGGEMRHTLEKVVIALG